MKTVSSDQSVTAASSFRNMPLAGAGRIDKNFIKITIEPRLQPLRMLVQHQGVRDAEALNIDARIFARLSLSRVADKKSAPLHFPLPAAWIFRPARRKRSSTRSPGFGSSQAAGAIALASCK